MSASRYRWTVGMAVYDTGIGGYEAMRAEFTAMSIAIHHPFVGEIIVVDNNPQPYSRLRDFISKVAKARYIEMPTPVGTSAPRNRVFEEAQCEYVACIDAHVFLYPGTFEAFMGFYAKRGLECPDLLHGSLMTEKGELMATHMNDQWRSDMLGVWGMGWLSPTGRLFSCIKDGPKDQEKCRYVTLGQEEGEQRLLTPEEIRGYKLPEDHFWVAHERRLIAAGCRQAREPFPCPGHGMGFFACRKEAWLPFHPACTGFGGEEITTGYRFRQAGRKVWAIPDAKWWHHFEKSSQYRGNIAYPLRLCDRVRNYILEFCRLDLDLEPIREHFGSRIPPEEWAKLLTGEEIESPSLKSPESGCVVAPMSEL